MNLTPGPVYALKVVNQYVPTTTVGKYVQAGTTATGPTSPLEVEVVDVAGNVVTSDNSTIVSIGLLATQGRGAIFVGNSQTIYTPTDPRILAPTTAPLPNPPNSFDFQATGQVSGGMVMFPDLYISAALPGTSVATTDYILAASTTSFATQVGATTMPFVMTNGPTDPPGAYSQSQSLEGRGQHQAQGLDARSAISPSGRRTRASSIMGSAR